MSFSIVNNSTTAVVTSIQALSSAYGSFTVTGGTYPLVLSGTVSGTNTAINNGKDSPDGSVLLFLKKGSATVTYKVNGSTVLTGSYSSGMIELKGPIVKATDILLITLT